MPFIKAQPNEFLVTGKGGKVVNRGAAVSVYLWPGTSFVLIPATQQEALFEMTQESRDGIPLRFKGMVVYRVVRPEETARMFDFSNGSLGHDGIKTLLSHVCLGELRAQVAHLTMQECIEQRKTTLTDAVAAALRLSQSEGWGIELDVVQVAQVFIVDQELRRQLEAETRNQIRSGSELSNLRMADELRLARAASERNLLQENLDTERERARIDRERAQLEASLERDRVQLAATAAQEQALRSAEFERERRQLAATASKEQALVSAELDRARAQLEAETDRERARLASEQELERVRSAHALELSRLEAEAPLRLLQFQRENELLVQQVELLQRQLQARELETQIELMGERARQVLRKEMLPLENVPLVAESLGKALSGAHLTFHGESSALMGALTPALAMLKQGLKLPTNGVVSCS